MDVRNWRKPAVSDEAESLDHARLRRIGEALRASVSAPVGDTPPEMEALLKRLGDA